MFNRKETVMRSWRVFHDRNVSIMVARSSLEAGSIFIRTHPGVRMDDIKEGVF